ncbi:hypothetical protein JN01_0611 [Entomoplasma freundtii]|uniref:Uncharacterized protein n=1 Tax=Entomoplasma freundtii TaxID=74700 RepID=A0A2K8NT46_9MOLU|nr:hypothetical protein [Entomoplasma freundtii]ATZ16348.1 hypothetical protein EFREU_v1c03220 [Entomoplasma freundtii]TDY56613.1 hypothetical protein JN01_0611 [Entomoplasma freundtii]
MTKKEIEEKILTLENQNKQFDKLLKQMEKKVTGHLRLLFFLPFFGFVIYQVALQKRKERSGFNRDAIEVKTEVIKNEYQILKLKKDLEKITGVPMETKKRKH